MGNRLLNAVYCFNRKYVIEKFRIKIPFRGYLSADKGGGFPVKAKLPRGNKGYLKLTAASTYSAGAITAGLVIDDDVLV